MKKILFAFVIILTACNSKNIHNNLLEENQSIPAEEEFFFSKENSCAEQIENYGNTGKLTFYFFDSEGMLPEDMYETSPSNILKKELREDSVFVNYAKKHFNFFVFDQACDVGRIKASNFDIKITPTMLLVDENGEVLLTKIGPHIPAELVEEIKEVLQNND